MTLPVDDVVCRFIRRDSNKWHKTKKRPRSDAFSDGRDQKGISLWHVERLRQYSVELEDLRLGTLCGAGQVHLTIGDFYEAAREVSDRQDIQSFHVQVEWRTDDAHVPPSWRQWNYAHAEALLPGNADRSVVQHFRHLLSLRTAKCVIPPDRFRSP